MSDRCVTIIRTKQGDDVIGILTGKMDDQLRVDHPFYARFNTMTGNVSMIPYCPLSDEIHFTFNTQDIQFVVTASQDISHKFLAMIDVDTSPNPEPEDPEDGSYQVSQVIAGNSTKH